MRQEITCVRHIWIGGEKIEIDFEGIPLDGMDGILPSQAVEWRQRDAKEGRLVSGFMRTSRFLNKLNKYLKP